MRTKIPTNNYSFKKYIQAIIVLKKYIQTMQMFYSTLANILCDMILDNVCTQQTALLLGFFPPFYYIQSTNAQGT
jgi:hypothetical protein